MSTDSPLKQKFQSDLKQAMKQGDKVKVATIRLLLSAVKNTEIARQADLNDGDLLGIVSKEAHQREESIAAFKEGNRPDLVASETAELDILKAYLPPAVSREEITEMAKKVIAEVGAQGMKDKGKVMPKIIAELKGRADGREINEVVSQLLA
ncbi:MAG: GatB/YqeY domain-containing protein [Dehalococcoidales bacterium]